MKKSLTLLVAFFLIASLTACALSPNLDLGWLKGDNQESSPQASTSENNQIVKIQLPDGSDALSENTLSSIYERVYPGVVSIFSTFDNGLGSGSGFVYDKQGHIITNYHVVDGAHTIEVDFPSGLKVYGNVVGTDLDSDIAVIQVDAAANELTPLPLGDSDQVKVGDMVLAIGNPFSFYASTMTMGIISAKGRILDSLRTDADQNTFTAGDIIQTDAAINSGNSGGPLINMDGEVIGINRAIQSNGTTAQGTPVNTGIGFSVSINIVKRVLPTLLKGEKYDYPYLGISSSSVEYTLSQWDELGIDQTSGAYITGVAVGGPAEQAGLRGGDRPTGDPNLLAGGDLVIAVDGYPVIVYGDLITYIFDHKSPGDQVSLTVIRDGNQMEVPLTLGKRP